MGTALVISPRSPGHHVAIYSSNLLSVHKHGLVYYAERVGLSWQRIQIQARNTIFLPTDKKLHHRSKSQGVTNKIRQASLAKMVISVLYGTPYLCSLSLHAHFPHTAGCVHIEKALQSISAQDTVSVWNIQGCTCIDLYWVIHWFIQKVDSICGASS